MDFLKKAQGMAAQYSGGEHEERSGKKHSSTGMGGSQDEKGMSDMIHSAQAFLTANKPGASGAASTTTTTGSHPGVYPPPPTAGYTSPVSTGATTQGHHLSGDQSQAHGKKPSYSEMYSSAQTLYQGLAAKKAGKEMDHAKVSQAAENLLHGVGEIGHLNEGQYGDYLKKAEGYIHAYGAKPHGGAKVGTGGTGIHGSVPGSVPGYQSEHASR